MSDTEFPVVVFHNPACGTSRNVVAMIREAGYEPKVVEYLKAGWTHDQLRELAAYDSVADLFAARLGERVLAYSGVAQKQQPAAQIRLGDARVRLRALDGLLRETVATLESMVAEGARKAQEGDLDGAVARFPAKNGKALRAQAQGSTIVSGHYSGDGLNFDVYLSLDAKNHVHALWLTEEAFE